MLLLTSLRRNGRNSRRVVDNNNSNKSIWKAKSKARSKTEEAKSTSKNETLKLELRLRLRPNSIPGSLRGLSTYNYHDNSTRCSLQQDPNPNPNPNLNLKLKLNLSHGIGTYGNGLTSLDIYIPEYKHRQHYFYSNLHYSTTSRWLLTAASPSSSSVAADDKGKAKEDDEQKRQKSDNTTTTTTSTSTSTSKKSTGSETSSTSMDSQASETGEGEEQQQERKRERERAEGEKEGEAEGKTESETGKTQLGAVLGRARTGLKEIWESGRNRVQETFAGDDQTWGEAWRELFGQKSSASKRKKTRKTKGASESDAGVDEFGVQWYEAVDKETGKRYYYTAQGEVKWADDMDEAASAMEDEDHPRASTTTGAGSAAGKISGKPSFLEKKVESLSQELSELEKEREKAFEENDMKKYKELNSKVRATRKEIQETSAKMNSDAVVTVEQDKSTWERFSESLKDAPLLGVIFGIGETEAAKKARLAAEDAREVWETSQNPWVYRAHAAWDTLFGENETAEAIRELRKLDPGFTVEGFMEECEEDTIPTVLLAFFREDEATIDRYCGEAAAASTKASIQERRRAGRKMDTHLLGVQDVNVFNMQVVEKLGPVIVLQFMAQQVDCLYDKKGNVVEGKEDNVVGVYYAFAMTPADSDDPQGQYDDAGNMRWKVKEFMLVGKVPYI